VALESDSTADVKTEELTAVIREIHDRVRARYPDGNVGGTQIPLPDLLPILHARDAAEGKVAAIGSVNPRPRGPVNAVIQTIKRQVARGLGWFVRDQIEFNRATLQCIEETLTCMNDMNRALKALGEEFFKKVDALVQESTESTQELKDIRSHWVAWRQEWEQKIVRNETTYLRAVGDLQASYQYKTAVTENNFRDSIRAQHAEFTASMKLAIEEVHKRFWGDLEKVRLDYERLIHNELRVVRQKAFAQNAAAVPATSISSPIAAPPIDYARFEARFRGDEEYVRKNQSLYVPYFQGRENVLDIGCGRGEFLQLMKEAGTPVRGIDLDPESVALCRAKGLDATEADLFQYLENNADASLGGIFCSQVIEHLPPERVAQFVKLAAAKLVREGVLAIETPNPECLAIFATHFYLDPTHTRPVPPNLLVFYFEEFGFGQIEVHRLSPAVESIPSLNSISADFRDTFFGALDYSVIARKL
jgi:2-polyprenyl-3-methyl-5-hydroxy-6-metoxy-1,4-benzoquinol methylase